MNIRADKTKKCPNCECPYYWNMGMVPQTLGYEGQYGCGYRDSEDGIAPPFIPPACSYAKSLLDRLDSFGAV